MSNKNKKFTGMVYSTNPNYQLNENQEEEADTLPIENQKLLVRMENKGRGGKTATLVVGFVGTAADLESLEKKLKQHIGTGGSSKDGEIIIQGDHRKKVLDFLLQKGYKAKAGN